mmetsp:Transcript_16795/g.46093  ORF Transcript_16795/g.46093 Transcript_16795/m.46093 type:complete len:90 (+) Transcript_16795:983-1252(+)
MWMAIRASGVPSKELMSVRMETRRTLYRKQEDPALLRKNQPRNTLSLWILTTLAASLLHSNRIHHFASKLWIQRATLANGAPSKDLNFA